MKNVNSIVAVTDIETLGLRFNTKIGSIAVVVGDILTGRIIAELYVVIDTDSQIERTTTQSTLDFWASQEQASPIAYAEMFDPKVRRLSLQTALERLNTFLDIANGMLENTERKINLFGNGPEFDNAIIIDAMNDFDMTPNWHYGGNQSIRTAVFFERLITGKDSKYEIPLEHKHHALHDARHEFEYLCAITKNIQGAGQ
jgi:hypothetical protein